LNKIDMIHSFVSVKISELCDDTNWAKYTLAKLRRGIGKIPGEVPELYEITLGGLSKELAGGNAPSTAEYAIYSTLTMYALNKTGMDNEPHKTGGDSFGQAVRKLVMIDNSSERLIRIRFNAAITASDMPGFSYHAHRLVKAFKSNMPAIRLDYPQFAVDLYKLYSENTKKEVLYKWTSDLVN